MPVKPIFYLYPRSKLISFRFIAENHVRELRKYFNVQTFDEKALPIIAPLAQLASRTLLLIQPYFYPVQVYERRLLAKVGSLQRVIGVDVADSDSISEEAVRLANYSTAMIVPSEFSRRSYVVSGVESPVHVIPHGIPDSWLYAPPSKPLTFKPLQDYKAKKGLTLIQTWALHSEYRKGQDLAFKIFNRLLAERKDVALVLRKHSGLHVYESPVEEQRPRPNFTVGASWLSDDQIMELCDVCDIFLLTSRGGGFEHPPLLALARGEIAIGAKGGAWEDYLPDWALIPSHRGGLVFENNPIHDGYGVEMEMDLAVDRLCDILDSMDEYRAKVRHHINTCVKQRFTWGRIGGMLRDIVLTYASG